MSLTIEQQIAKAPDFVTCWNGVICFKLLSNFADHYNKSMYWIKSQHALYLRRFRRIPANFLKTAFLDYLTYEMPHYLPAITEVYKYVAARDDFDSRWLGMELGSRYCLHCRTTDDGLSGGMRSVFYYGFVKSLGKKAERSFSAKCNCEAGLRRAGIVYTELVSELERAGGKDCEVAFSYFDEEAGRLITPKEQTNYAWRRRIALGHYKYNEEGHIEPDFSHPIYRTSLGRAMASLYGFELPRELEPVETDTNGSSRDGLPKSISDSVNGVVNGNWQL
jgi:hypothetical protein